MKICIKKVCKLRPKIGNTLNSINKSFKDQTNSLNIVSKNKSYSNKFLSFFSSTQFTSLSFSSSFSSSSSSSSSSLSKTNISRSFFTIQNILLYVLSFTLILSQCSYAVPASSISKFILNSSHSNPFDSGSLSLESLLSNPKLEDAIQRLTEAWNSVNTVNNVNTVSTSNKKILISNLIPSSLPATPTLINESNTFKLSTNEASHSSRERRSLTQSAHSSSTAHHHSSNDEASSQFGDSNLLNNCTKCREKDEARAMRIETIKQVILSRLGFDRAPNVSARSLPKIPPLSHFIDQYNLAGSSNIYRNEFKTKNEPDNEKLYNSYKKRHTNPNYFGPLELEHDSISDRYFVAAERSIVFAQKVPENKIVEREHRAQWFAFPSSISNSIVERAKLWVFVNSSEESLPKSAHGSIVIYQISREKPSLLMVKKKKLNHSVIQEGGWIQIDITTMVEQWFKGQDNLGLSIHSWDSRGKTLSVVHAEDVASDSEIRPFIEVHVGSPIDSKRQKRSATLICDEKSDEVRCCRYPLTIDFVEFGWEWIIAPKRYEANYCSGECSLLTMTGAFPHTHLVRQSVANNNISGRSGRGINDKSIGSRPSGGCCSPRKMSPISMLYLDNNLNVIYGVLPNMVVDQCDCS